MSMPAWSRPQRIPNGEVTGPFTGQIMPLEPPWIGPAGSGSVVLVDACASASCSWICAFRSEMSPSRCSAVASTWSSAAAFWSRTASSSASRASSCIRVRSSSAFLASISSLGDADRAPPVSRTRRAGTRTRSTIAASWSWIRVEVVVAVDEVVEAVGVEDDGQRVGLVRLVDVDQALGQDVEGAGRACREARRGSASRSRAGRSVSRSCCATIGSRVAQDRHLARELGDLVRVVADLAREHVPAGLDVLELGLLRGALGLEVLGHGGAAGGREQRDEAEGERTARRGACDVPWAHLRGRAGATSHRCLRFPRPGADPARAGMAKWAPE